MREIIVGKLSVHKAKYLLRKKFPSACCQCIEAGDYIWYEIWRNENSVVLGSGSTPTEAWINTWNLVRKLPKSTERTSISRNMETLKQIAEGKHPCPCCDGTGWVDNAVEEATPAKNAEDRL